MEVKKLCKKLSKYSIKKLWKLWNKWDVRAKDEWKLRLVSAELKRRDQAQVLKVIVG